jgi:ABC-2 type transport system permease protein
MRALSKMTLVEAKLFWREPVGLFFTLVFPVMVMLLFSAIFGNGAIPGDQGLRMIDVMAPAYTGMVIGTTALLGLPITLAGYRQQGALRRLRATPVHPSAILAAHALVNLLMTAVGIVLLLFTARVVFELRLPEAPFSVALAFVLASLSFFALGFVLAGVLPNARTAQIVGQVVFFPMFFLSGAAGIQPDMFPEALRRVSNLLPLTYVVELVRKLWLAGEWDLRALVVLVCVAVASVLVSAATFRWE